MSNLVDVILCPKPLKPPLSTARSVAKAWPLLKVLLHKHPDPKLSADLSESEGAIDDIGEKAHLDELDHLVKRPNLRHNRVTEAAAADVRRAK